MIQARKKENNLKMEMNSKDLRELNEQVEVLKNKVISIKSDNKPDYEVVISCLKSIINTYEVIKEYYLNLEDTDKCKDLNKLIKEVKEEMSYITVYEVLSKKNKLKYGGKLHDRLWQEFSELSIDKLSKIKYTRYARVIDYENKFKKEFKADEFKENELIVIEWVHCSGLAFIKSFIIIENR